MNEKAFQRLRALQEENERLRAFVDTVRAALQSEQPGSAAQGVRDALNELDTSGDEEQGQ
jgi:hypothetical protein